MQFEARPDDIGNSNIKTENKKDFEGITVNKDNPFLSYFWKSFETGNFVPIPENAVENIVNHYLDTTPMITLSDKECEALREDMTIAFKEKVLLYNSETEKLLKKFVYFIPGDVYVEYSGENRKVIKDTVVYITDEKNQAIENLGHHPSSTEEKVDYFSKPFFWDDSTFVSIVRGGESVSTQMFVPGSRSLYYYPGYAEEKDFIDLLERVKKDTQKEKIKMLDVGGNIGRALYDAKKVDPNIETFNMTLDEAPAIYGDHVIRTPVEVMPKNLEEEIDIIESNVSFRYFSFPDIALFNIIKALSVGGEADIDFQADRSPTNKEDLINRINNLFLVIKKLEDGGYIKIDYGPRSKLFFLEDDQMPWYVQAIYTGSRAIGIKKLKSTKELDFLKI